MSFSRLAKSSYPHLGMYIRTKIRAFHVSRPRLALYPNANADTFSKVIAQKDRITVVDFYADWCGPCKTLTPVLEKLTADGKTKSALPLDLVKVDIDSDDGQALAMHYKVTAVPTVYAFLDSVAIAQFQGAIPEISLRRFLEELKKA